MVDRHDNPEDQYRDAYELLQEIERDLDELNDVTDGMDVALASTADTVHDIKRELSIDDFEQEMYL